MPSSRARRRYSALVATILGAGLLWKRFGAGDRFQPSMTVEVDDLFDFPPFESVPLMKICNNITWSSSIIFTCNESYGGVGNVRNSILNCVRYAIAAGASLVLPNIVLRNSSNPSDLETGLKIDMSYMFDIQYFLDSLRLSCPPMTIYTSLDEVPNYNNAGPGMPLLPEVLEYNDIISDTPTTGIRYPAQWPKKFHNWLDENFANDTGPRIIDLQRSYLTYPIHSDGRELARTFGSILRFRPDVRRLATKILQNIKKTYSLEVNLEQNILLNAFFAAHLRTEEDAAKAWPREDWEYGRYETQSKLYLEQATRSNSTFIYVASGDLHEVSKFANDSFNTPPYLPVRNKFDFLTGKDLEELKALKWDQQAMVDFLVCLKASDFAGIGHSSFAWNIALKRHRNSTVERCLDGPQILSDERSLIYGLRGNYPEYPYCMWS